MSRGRSASRLSGSAAEREVPRDVTREAASRLHPPVSHEQVTPHIPFHIPEQRLTRQHESPSIHVVASCW